MDADREQFSPAFVELAVDERGSGFWVDEGDPADAPQEYERSGSEIGHELLKRRRFDLDAQRDDQHRIAGLWVVEARHGVFRWASDRHLVHAEVVRVAVGLDRATKGAEGLLADAKAARSGWVVNARAHPGENHGSDMSQRDWIAVVRDEQFAAFSLRSNSNAQTGCRSVIRVLNRLDNSLERPRAQALGSAL
ncbi:MAG: hypothetical protein M3071_05230 [Actinomycetota bacterium]|nr:hypothetical protein [Actinomycetota bacterium]